MLIMLRGKYVDKYKGAVKGRNQDILLEKPGRYAIIQIML